MVAILALVLVVLPGAPLLAQRAQNRAEERAPSRTELLRTLRSFADSVRMPEPYTRERFAYQTGERPDPVLPPPVIAKRQEALPEIHLTAIIYEPDEPTRSVAVVRTGSNNSRPHRVVVGDRVGEIEILAIHPKFIVIGARQLGRMQTDTLSLDRNNR